MSISPVLCKFWRLYGGVIGDLLQECLCRTQVCCTQRPCLCGSPLLTHTSSGDSQTWFCLSLCGVSGSWCTQGSVCSLQESVSPVLCKFWWFCGGLMATSSKRAHATPRSAAPRAPAPSAVHCRLTSPQETPRHSSVSVSVGSLGRGARKVCLSPLSIPGGYRV